MDTRSLTYDELGAALGIASASAKRLAIRHKWPKHPGNDGKARVTVPLERLEQAKADASDGTSDDTDDTAGDDAGDSPGDVSVTVTALVGQLERMTAELLEARKLTVEAVSGRDAERAHAAQASAEAAALRAVLEVERQRVADAQADAERWRSTATAPRGLVAWIASARSALKG